MPVQKLATDFLNSHNACQGHNKAQITIYGKELNYLKWLLSDGQLITYVIA